MLLLHGDGFGNVAGLVGGVLICFSCHQTSNAALNVLRIHSETVCFLAFANPSNVRNSVSVTLIRKVSALALPLGRAGRPTFFGLGLGSGMALYLLHDGYLYCGLWRNGRGDVKHGDAAPGVLWIVCCVCPGIGSVGLGMALEVEYLHHPVPKHLALKDFGYMHTFNVLRLRLVQLADHVLEFFYLGHAVASSRSPTLQKLGMTPAAIAGVQRSVL